MAGHDGDVVAARQLLADEDPRVRAAALGALTRLGALTEAEAAVALAAFVGPEVDAALQQALNDRDWQVRQAAEDLLAD